MSSFRVRHAARPSVAAARAAPARRAAGVVVVTHDPALENTLRAALPATPILIATTPATLADLLMSGGAGALVLDAGALDAAAIVVARRLAEQFPDVPLVAVGSREDEARLAGLISAGFVYRFLHRPLSAARARTLIDAALRRGEEIGPGARPTPARAPRPATPHPANRRALVLVVAVLATVVGVAAWLLRRPAAAPRPAGEAHGVAPAALRQTPPAASLAPSALPELPALPALPAAIADGPAADATPAVRGPSTPAPTDSLVSAEAPVTTPATAREEPAMPSEARETTTPSGAATSDSATGARATPSAVLPDPLPDPPVPPDADPAVTTADPPPPAPGSG
jgi:DNA-binding NarL/FixJ family response regulator